MPDEREPLERGADLFDRWLTHREGTEPEAPRPRTYGVPRTSRTGRPDGPEEQAGSRLAEPGPAANENTTPATGGPSRPLLSRVRSSTETARARLDRAVHGTTAPAERNAATREPASAPPKQLANHPAQQAGQAIDATPEQAPARSAYEELRAQREAASPAYSVVEPPSIDFRPRMIARILTSALLVAGLLATGAAGWHARDSRTATDVGLVAILALLTGVVWAVRAGTVPTRVSLHSGRLEAQTQAGRFLFDLSSEHTTLEMIGSPGRRGWKVLVHRRGRPPFVFTGRMVDPHQLTHALRFYRPDL